MAPTCTRGSSGVADHEATDDEHALRIVREIVANLNLPSAIALGDRADPEDPSIEPVDDLYGAVSARSRARRTTSAR